MSATGLPSLGFADAQWVERTRQGLSQDEKIAQLFNLAVRDSEPQALQELLELRPGGFTRFPGSNLELARNVTRTLIEASTVPPLVSGDIEGGDISYGFATAFPNQLGIAACNEIALTTDIARALARESKLVGFNWAFAPVVDVSAAFRSSIVGTRSYGGDPERVLAHARAFVRTLQSEGLAATAKHWPGEGFDDRDQHLLTTVNRLAMPRWREIFGRIYRTLIEDGLLTIMAGHIALPAWHGHDRRDAYVPASLSRHLNIDLLRGELGFQGLLVSDATVMGGMATWLPRAEAVPAVIENGCDMFLFSREPRVDFEHMKAGLRSGRLSEARLEEAVTRVLSLKARLGLHRSGTVSLPEDTSELRSPAYGALARHAAAASLTLVKDTQAVLPLDARRHRRVTLFIEPDGGNFIDGAPDRSFEPLFAKLRAQGFELRSHDPEEPPDADNTDLVFYVVGRESTPVIASGRLDWAGLHGGARKAMARYWPQLPTVMVSFGHPYLLYDAPDVPLFINAYSAIASVQEALVDALLTGPSAFGGSSPVDALCGCPELRY